MSTQIIPNSIPQAQLDAEQAANDINRTADVILREITFNAKFIFQRGDLSDFLAALGPRGGVIAAAYEALISAISTIATETQNASLAQALAGVSALIPEYTVDENGVLSVAEPEEPQAF